MDPDSINISSDVLNDTISISLSSADTDWLITGDSNSSLTWNTAGAAGATGSYTYATNGTNYAWSTTNNTLQVRGDSEFDGNITVKGRSLTEFMDSVEQRLNILRPNAELEADWDQLRELGEQYRKLEQQLTEKAQMWAALQRTQPPVDK